MKQRFFFNRVALFYDIAVDEVTSITSIDNDVNIIANIDNLQLLDQIKRIDRLIIESGNAKSASFDSLYKHSEIEELMLDYYETDYVGAWSVDLSHFPNLKILVSNSSLNYRNIDHLQYLKSLFVKWWFERDLSQLMNIPIESLVIMKGLLSIDGYSNGFLKELSISYSPLDKVSDLSLLPTLEVLEVDHCPKIDDWESFQSKSLKVLLLLGNNVLESVSFIANNPSLLFFTYEGTIQNCDLLPLVNLQHCSLLPHKRIYNIERKKLNYNPKAKIVQSIESHYSFFSKRSFAMNDQIVLR